MAVKRYWLGWPIPSLISTLLTQLTNPFPHFYVIDSVDQSLPSFLRYWLGWPIPSLISMLLTRLTNHFPHFYIIDLVDQSLPSFQRYWLGWPIPSLISIYFWPEYSCNTACWTSNNKQSINQSFLPISVSYNYIWWFLYRHLEHFHSGQHANGR